MLIQCSILMEIPLDSLLTIHIPHSAGETVPPSSTTGKSTLQQLGAATWQQGCGRGGWSVRSVIPGGCRGGYQAKARAGSQKAHFRSKFFSTSTWGWSWATDLLKPWCCSYKMWVLASTSEDLGDEKIWSPCHVAAGDGDSQPCLDSAWWSGTAGTHQDAASSVTKTGDGCWQKRGWGAQTHCSRGMNGSRIRSDVRSFERRDYSPQIKGCILHSEMDLVHAFTDHDATYKMT